MIAQSCLLVYLLAVSAATLPAGLAVHLEAAAPGPCYPELPVILSVSVTNGGGEPLHLPAPSLSARDNPDNTLDIFVSIDGETPRRVGYAVPDFSPPGASLPRAPEMIVLRPGDSWSGSVVLSHDWNPAQIVPLIAGGEVRVWAALYGAAGTAASFAVDRNLAMQSNELILAVAELTDREAQALARLRRIARPWLAAHPAAVAHVPQGDDFRAFQELARMAGATPYTRHAQMVVAYMLAQGNALDPVARRAPQPGTAQLWVERAMGQHAGIWHPEWISLAETLEPLIASSAPISSEEESS